MGFDRKVSRLQNHALSSSFFGEKVTYRPQSGGFFPLKGIFFDDFVSRDDSSDVEVFLQQLNIDLKVSDLGFTPAEKDEIEIKGALYLVNSVKFDGLGMATLFLYRKT